MNTQNADGVHFESNATSNHWCTSQVSKTISNYDYKCIYGYFIYFWLVKTVVAMNKKKQQQNTYF